MDLIAEEIPRLVVLRRGGGAGDLNKIEAAERHWDECKKFEPLERLRIYRNKYVAHLSDPPACMEDPLVAELFTLSRMVAKVSGSTSAWYRYRCRFARVTGERIPRQRSCILGKMVGPLDAAGLTVRDGRLEKAE